MSQKNIKNIAASIRQKLLNKSKELSRPFNELLQYHALERFLYRLSISKYREKFILKGALLFTVWQHSTIRSTSDIDLLGKISNDQAGIIKAFREICDIDTENDGMLFDKESLTTEQITLDAEYEGVKVLLYGYLGTARIRIQIDIGFSDVVTPGSVLSEYPTILDLPAARLYCYNRETVVAEKFQTMVKRDIFNSRMKDFYDIWILSRSFDFEGSSLANAVRNTFERRETDIIADIAVFQESFHNDQGKKDQWKGFLKRSKLSNVPVDLKTLIMDINIFLQPVLTCIIEKKDFHKTWQSDLRMWQ
jgi:hypothetical protein